MLLAAPALAGPVVCSTTLEAPDPSAESKAPVQVTTCLPVETTRELINRRFFSWNAPYEHGVDVIHQITDLFGIAVAGSDGSRLMGLGFPDQTVLWDASAIGNTVTALIEEQSPATPWRTMDLANGFGSSIALEAENGPMLDQQTPATLQPLW